ncbi:hypothetical protein ACSBR1_008077 [Camellia fascicularis]
MLPFISSAVNLLDLSHNSFVGSIYHTICGRIREPNNLYILNLGNNNLSGGIPNCWKNWPYLKVLKLENNNLMGTIPHSIGHLAFLESLHLRHNNFSGKLPQSLQHCTKLVLIDLARNEFIGSIPTWIGNSFSHLMVLILRSNKFQGEVQENTFLVIKGREVEYSTTLKLVTSMDLSKNNLSGEIPMGLTKLVGLYSLNLSGNHFTGKIPKNIGDMKQLESLDFSLNKLCGEIPLSMSSLTFLSHLNLSYNNLIGQIPLSTQLQSLEISSFVGNKLCGPPLPNCDTNKVIPKVGHGGNEEGEGFPDVWFYEISALGFGVGFWVVVGPLLFKMRWRIA